MIVSLSFLLLLFCKFYYSAIILNVPEVTQTQIESIIFDLVTANDIEGVRLLIETGYDLNIRKYDGSTALIVAATNNKIEMVKLLLSCSVNVNSVDFYNNNALYCSVSDDSNEELVKMLLDHGGDPSTVSTSSALNSVGAAIAFENFSIFELLCTYSAYDYSSLDGYHYCLGISQRYYAINMESYLRKKRKELLTKELKLYRDLKVRKI